MTPTVHVDPRPEAMSDVPGVCELPLTRAIVQYRDVHEIELAGGRIQDIGMALVLEGRYASSAEVLDLGSGDVKTLDLSAELVVLDWAYEPTLDHARSLIRRDPGSQARGELRRFAFRLALRVLERVGFGPLTRATFLRIGFRDICRDLDLHEGTSVRVARDTGGIVRAYLDYDGNALAFRTADADRDPELEAVLQSAFPGADLRRLEPPSNAAGGGYQVRLPLPLSFAEAKEELRRIREGLDALVRSFEPERHQSTARLVETFGRRDTLAHLQPGGERAGPRKAAARTEGASESRSSFGAADRVSPGEVFGSSSVH